MIDNDQLKDSKFIVSNVCRFGGQKVMLEHGQEAITAKSVDLTLKSSGKFPWDNGRFPDFGSLPFL